jgi:hypothetical protein
VGLSSIRPIRLVSWNRSTSTVANVGRWSEAACPPRVMAACRQKAPTERKAGACVSGTMLPIAKLILVTVNTTCDRRYGLCASVHLE